MVSPVPRMSPALAKASRSIFTLSIIGTALGPRSWRYASGVPLLRKRIRAAARGGAVTLERGARGRAARRLRRKRDTPQPEERERVIERREWSIAVHGGSGSMPKERLAGREPAFHDALGRAVTLGAEMLRGGASSLDTVEAVVRLLEDDPLFNAGKGAVFTHEGTIELDAAIMEGKTLQCRRGGRDPHGQEPDDARAPRDGAHAARLPRRRRRRGVRARGRRRHRRSVLLPHAGALGRAPARAASRKHQRGGATDPGDGHGGSGGARSRRATSPPRPRPAVAPTSGSGASATCR